MTKLQERFIRFYNGNATEAAKKAGYSKKSARSIGQENMTKPDILKAIQEREKKQDEPLIADREELQQFWTRGMRDENVDMRDRIKCSELLGKSQAVFSDRVEVKQDTAVTFKWQE